MESMYDLFYVSNNYAKFKLNRDGTYKRYYNCNFYLTFLKPLWPQRPLKL